MKTHRRTAEGPPSPMFTTCTQPLYSSVLQTSNNLTKKLDSYITAKGLPEDDYNHHRFMTPLMLADNPQAKATLYNIVDDLLCLFKEPTQSKYRETQRQMIEFVLLNLAQSSLTDRWTLVVKNKAQYSNDHRLLDFSYGSLMGVIETLIAEKLINYRKGGKFTKGSMCSRIYPMKLLEMQLYPLALMTQQAIKPPFITINEPEAGWQTVLSNLSGTHPDRLKMETINEFLKSHTWACKGPIRLIYKHSIFSGGRIYTPFQNQPVKAVPLRINTLIDGEPIAEVDFNASHLRMGLALFGGEDAGDDPYRKIADYAQTTRDKVKGYITISLSSSSAKSAHNALKNNGYGGPEIEALENATRRCYPSLRLYDGLGIHLQSLEGQILMHVMYQGVLEGKVVLPIHDAVAVKAQHAEWAAQRMEAAWVQVCCKKGDAARPRLKTIITQTQ